MSQISASIDVDVPLRFADREWTEFVWRMFAGYYTMPVDDFVRGGGDDDSEADQGVVRFETEGDRLTKVTVELAYSPRNAGAAEEEEARVRARLQRDLKLYHDFLLRRCDETQCRTVWEQGPTRQA